MEIRRWLCYVVNCVLVCCIVAKPFSLNEIIEAESRQKAVVQTTISPKLEESDSGAERFSLSKGLRPLNRISKKFKETGTINFQPLSKKISALKYKKTFQIKSPLKPKRVKSSLRIRQKRKNQSVKREVNGNEILNQKYIPLLRSLSMLFDNIIGTDSGESFELPKNKRKRLRYYLEETDDSTCQCSPQRESNANSESEEKTVTSTETITTAISVTAEVASTTTDNTPTSNIGSFRQYKNVSLLFPRNTSSARRNDYGLGERSSTAHNWSIERYISGNHGDSKHNTEREQNKSYAENDEEYTDSTSRNNASGIRTRDRLRDIRDREIPKSKIKTGEDDAISEDESEELSDKSRGHVDESDGQDKLETGGDEAKSAKLLPKYVRRQRGFLPADKVGNTAESIQSEENNKESDLDVAHNSSDDQQFPNRSSSLTSEIQKVIPQPKAIIHHAFKLEKRPKLSKSDSLDKTPHKKGPVVVIIDGYSVTRHKNGDNKLSEKAIHVTP